MFGRFGRFVTVAMTLAAGTLGAAPLKVALYVDDGCRSTQNQLDEGMSARFDRIVKP